MTKIIAITGNDGCGKSSIIKGLQQEFMNSTTGEIWQPMYRSENPFSSKQAVDAYICALSPNARTLFLAHALLESTHEALKSKKDYVFLNAYYFKYFTSELTLGADLNLIQELVRHFPKPDFTIRLNVNLETILQRRAQFSRYECGLMEATPEHFYHFQLKRMRQWKHFEDTIDLNIDNNGSMEETLNHISKAIQSL